MSPRHQGHLGEGASRLRLITTQIQNTIQVSPFLKRLLGAIFKAFNSWEI